MTLADIQKEKPKFNLPIERVGITDFKMPIYIYQLKGGHQHTVAEISAYVDLFENKKGINMSRIPISLQKFLDRPLNSDEICSIAQHILKKSEAERCQLIYKFPYFIKKLAPESKEPGIVYYNVTFDVTKEEIKNYCDFMISVESNTTSLCPCSKDISKYGAHNQRSSIKITCCPEEKRFLWIEELIDIAEESSSCEIFSVLKRVDEKVVTEKAYDNAKFVEDMGREIFHKLEALYGIKYFEVEVKNFESIHQHNAFCKLTSIYKK